MKLKLLAIFVLFSSLFPIYSKGMFSDEPVEEVREEPVAIADENIKEETAGQPLNNEPLFEKLNQAGFDTPTGDNLPSVDFQLPDLSGADKKLSDYRGQVVFLNFWATWCGPCRSEMPAMESVYQELKDDGFVILAVDLGEDRETVQNFADDLGLSFPIVLDQAGEVGGAYEARSIPTTYLIGKDGNILGRAVGARPWEEDLYIDLFKEILNM